MDLFNKKASLEAELAGLDVGVLPSIESNDVGTAYAGYAQHTINHGAAEATSPSAAREAGSNILVGEESEAEGRYEEVSGEEEPTDGGYGADDEDTVVHETKKRSEDPVFVEIEHRQNDILKLDKRWLQKLDGSEYP